jgi:Nucleotidyltransferase domain
MKLAEVVPALVGAHPSVSSIRLTGSRADGTAHELSDWDFAVETSDFPRLADELPRLVEPLRPLAAQWDRYSDHACYMLMLRGPQKVDLIFPDEKQDWAAAWEPSPDTLVAIDHHFWDWILWLEQKERARNEHAVKKSLGDMYRLMLRPMGAVKPPASIPDALGAYLGRRAALEERFGVSVPRELQDDVQPAVSRAQ